MIIFFCQRPRGYRRAERHNHKAYDYRCYGGHDKSHTQRVAVRAGDKQVGVQRRYELTNLRHHRYDGYT